MEGAYVYILECADSRFYVGSHRGEDIGDRVAEHNAGLYPNAWTYRRRPVRFVWCEQFDRYEDAVVVERKLKGWSRAKKLAFMRGDVAALKALARWRS